MFILLNVEICAIVVWTRTPPVDRISWMGFVSQVPGSGAATQEGSVWRRVSAQLSVPESEFTASQPEGHLPGLQCRAGGGGQHVLQTQRAL